ncbi:MAG: lytic murein transglycosylase [Alphaproteobacteria bacterium]|nr:lytic murein transglycosylase [Alphaproteobacteria bacterium]
MRARSFGILAMTAFLAAAPAAAATDADFTDWLAGFRSEAAEKGISPATIEAALTALEPIPRVIELDRKQPERTVTFDDYIARILSPTRIATGRAKLVEHAAVLDAVAKRFGVQPRFIVALWGIETSYGGYTGSFSVIGALATLAWEGRRADYFRGELLAALRIVDQGHVRPAGMMGSWAGAMGHSQFMPSSFLAYAVDWNGDGAKDIWGTHADVFASAANYLKNVGWREELTWGREVKLPSGFAAAAADLKVAKPLAAWQQLGVRRSDGGDLPDRAVDASIVLPGGAGGPAYLVYDNYRSLMRWNRSLYFATAVGLLADRIGAP